MSRPIIAIVGRPNVGKSTLFNRLIRRRAAIVQNVPGVTRDRHYADTEIEGRPVTVVDTGGFVPDGKDDDLAQHVRLQAQAAVEEAELVVLVCDGRTGVTPGDQEVARYLRRQSRPIILAVNKCDDHRMAEALAAEFHRLGLGDPLPIAAEHNEGTEALIGSIVAKLPGLPGLEAGDEEPVLAAPATSDGLEEIDGAAPPDDVPVRIAVVGRPNVGKSTLVNALLGQKRVIVSPLAGTTRDPIDTELTFGARRMILTDTAGIRRKAAISQRVEEFSVLGAMRAIERSDVAVLVLDATEAGVDQDLKIAALAEEKGRALLVCVNKWDLRPKTAREEAFREELKWYMKWVAWAPMVFVSALDGLKVNKVLTVALELFEQQHFRAPTPMLNRVVEHVTTEHSLPVVGRGRPLRIYYAAQVGTAPPAFALTCNAPTAVPDRYQRYVSNYLRETFRLKVPIRIFWRERPGKKERAERAQRFQARERSRRRR